jgi:hypothetical protein
MRRWSLFLLLLLLTRAGPLRAEPASSAASVVERADQLFREGTSAFEAERYSDAYGALRSAWDLAPSYRHAAGLGQVELHLGQYRDAAEHLAYCLRNFPETGDAVARSHVQEGLEQAREHVAALRVRVDPEGAEIAIDGVSVGHAPLEGLVFVNPGSHVVQASAEGRTAATATVEAPVRVTRDVSLSLAEAPRDNTSASPNAASAPASAAHPATVRSTGLSQTAWTLIVGGALTAAAVGTAVLFEVKGTSADRDVEDLRREIGSGGDCRAPSSQQAPLCSGLADAADARNRDDRIAMIAAIGAGVIGAATVGTVVLLQTRSSSRRTSASGVSMQVHAMPGGAALMLGGPL